MVLSLDGRKEVHDRLRKDYAGQGSYDLIVPKFQRFVQQRGDRDYYMPGHLSPTTTPTLPNDILPHGRTWASPKLSMEPVVAAPGEPCALTEEDLPVVFEQYEILAKEMLKREKEGRPFTFYHYMLDLEGGPCIHKRMSGCGSGTEYLAVTPWGEAVPLPPVCGRRPPTRMGGRVEGVVTNTTMGEKFHRCNVCGQPGVPGLLGPALLLPEGAPPTPTTPAATSTGTYEYGCELFKKRMECAIMIKAAQAGRPR